MLISDEAHHLNVDTGKKLSVTDEDHRTTWENTIKHIFRRNADNVLLEFTATCDLDNPSIKSKYESLIVYDYLLQKFYDDRWSKEILTLRTTTLADRVFNALVLSQYRLKIFQDHRLSIKPVVLFKSRTIKGSQDFMKKIIGDVKNLRGSQLQALSVSIGGIICKAFDYFAKSGISFEELAAELRDDFSEALPIAPCLKSRSWTRAGTF